MPRLVQQGLAKARRNSRSLCHFGASAHSGRRIRRACGAVVEGGSFGLSAMTVTAALGWMMPQAQAQVMSAPEWCAEFLDSKPHPAPIVNLFERVRDAIPAKGESEAMADSSSASKLACSLRTALVGAYGSSRIVIQAPVAARYDPDRGLFDVRRIVIIPSTSWGEAGPSVPQPGCDQVVVETRPVQSGMQDEYEVALVNLPLAKAASWLRVHFVVPISPERAAAIGGKISVLIVGDLAPPGIVESVSRKAPTSRNPNDVTIKRHYVAITTACGAVVATSTREVLHRLN